ncbi:hypothetical protein QYF36_003223 [Acer negundo]|nr:hypothetical protein QYF36_003223 [Acer negundo]
MAEMKDTHIVEIPVDEEHQQKVLCCLNTITAIQHHPLMEISQSPGHLLLLKLWQREEDRFGRRISLKESRMDSIRREIFQLCCFFLIFHGFFLTLLFTSSDEHNNSSSSCKKWWIPSMLSLSTSLVYVFLVQVKLYRYWKVWRQLQRERNDNRALTRCIQELRMKGASFDLSKEPQSGKRMKSSSVEIKWKPITWCSQYLITICLSVSKFALYFNVSSVLDPWMHFPEKHSRNRFDSHNSAKSIFLVLYKGMKHVGPMVLLLMLISRETVANSIHRVLG